MTTPRQPVSIIVPTLNEADNISLLFARIDATLVRSNIPYEIVVVDDHSTDQTQSIARSSPYPVRVFDKLGRRGKAYSLLEGFEHAQHDIVCMIDADLQYPPEAIGNMYDELLSAEADLVITKRVDQQTSLLRQVSTKTFNLLFTRLLFGIKYDTQSGLKLFRKEILQHMQLSPSPWSFDLEFIVRSLENEYKILSVDIPFMERYAGEPKLHVATTAIELAKASLKLRRATSAKRVRYSYKQNLQVTRGSLLLIGVIGVAFFAGLGNVPVAHVAADTDPVKTVLSSGVSTVSKILGSAPSTIVKTTTTAPSSATPPSKAPNTTTVPSTAPASSTPASTTATKVPAPSVAATTTTAPSTSVAPKSPDAAADETVASGPTASLAAAQAAAAGTTAAATIPSQASAQNTEPTGYYQAASAISPATERLLMQLAMHLFEIGALVIGLGIISLSVKMRLKHSAQPAHD